MNDFMKGRNGADELTIVMGFAGIVIAMIGSMARIQWLSWIAIAVIVLGVLRGLSKNIDARRKENTAFVAATANVPGLGKFVASLGGGTAAANASRAAGTSKEDFERAKRTAKKMWKGRKTRHTSSAPTAARCCPSPRARARSASPAPSATPRWRHAPSSYTIGKIKAEARVETSAFLNAA